MDAIRFNVENVTTPEEIARLTRLAVLNELSNKLTLIARIFDICGQSIDISMANFNPKLNEIVSVKSMPIAGELSDFIEKYKNTKHIEDLLALTQALLAATSTTLEICSTAIRKYVKEKLLEMGAVEDER